MAIKLKRFLNNFVSTLVSFTLITQPLLAQSIVADANGPTVIQTANGTTMVMINTPDANGVSHNVYVEFGVGPDGAIINNVDTNTYLSDIAGQVQGNYNLSGGAASVIINEVTTANSSVLNGYLEVAGQRADLIIANPYGITCNGCGFINTSQLTMTTGTPTFTGGSFTGLSVEDGMVEIGANGLDAADSTRFDIISRQIRVAGAVEGQRIRLVAGRNDVIYATGEVIEKAPDGSAGPALAIDSTVLGGMYADAITITSTEDGVGVRAPTNMASNAGAMTITADGRLVIGSASAVGNVTVQSSDDVVIEDSVVATQDVSVTSAEDLILEANAKLVADATANLTVGNALTLGAGADLSGSAISASASSVDVANLANLLSAGSLSLNVNSINSAGTIGATGGALALTADTITNTGLLFGDSTATLRSDGVILNDGGAIVSNGDILIRGDSIAAAAQFTNTDGGTVESITGDISIAATTIENSRPAPTTDGSVTLDDVDLTGENCDPDCYDPAVIGSSVTLVGEAAQIIAASGSIALNGNDVTNAYSLISAGGNITINATTLTNIGLNIYRPTPGDPTSLSLIGAVFGTIEAAGAVVGTVSGYVQNGALSDGAIVSGGVSTGVGSISADDIGNPNLLVVNVDPNAEFLVESRPEFIDLDQFISSDYFLTAIQYDPELKRFGDAYAEALYIRKQLLALLGQLILEAGIDERAQIQAMYDNAINAMENLDLKVGVALTPTQISALTTDIIWLEETIIDGQRVLAPRVYLANPAIRFAALSGASINGQNIVFVSDRFDNTGTLRASNDININVNGTFYSEGVITAEDILISAEKIKISTGARRVFSVRPDQASSLLAFFMGSNYASLFKDEAETIYDFRDRAARPSSIEAGNTLVLRAKGDIITQGAQISAGQGVALIAGGNIIVGALELASEVGDKEGKNHDRREALLYLTSQITSGGDISLLSTGNAGGQVDIVLQGATLNADGALSMIARGGNLVLAAAADITFRDRAKSKGGFFYKKVTRDQVFDISHQVTSLTGESITGVSNAVIQVEGATFDVPGLPNGSVNPGQLALVSVNAGLTFTAPTDIRAESHYSSRKILGGLITNSKDLRTLVTDSLGSVAETAGDMLLNSGADLTLTSVDFQVGGAFGTEVAGATYMLAAIDMDYRFLVEHRDNGIITTDIRQEDLRESITYNAISAEGGVNFDENSPILFAGVRNPFIDSAHPGAWVAGDNKTGQLNIANAYFGGPEVDEPDAADGGEDTYWRDDDEWSKEGKLRIIQASLPTSAEGAQFAYMDGLLARDTTIIDPVELANYHFKEVKHSISPAFQALVSIAVGQWVGGWGIWSTLSNATSAAFATGVQTFTTNFITQSIAGVVSGEYDLGKILEGAAFAGVSAGLASHINLESFGIELGPNASNPLLGFGDDLTISNLLEKGIDSAITSGLNSAYYDTSFGEGFIQSYSSAVVALAMADFQTLIGDQNLGEGSFEHVALHGVVGCVAAELSRASCGAGAAGAVAQAIYSGLIEGTEPKVGEFNSDEEYDAAYAAWLDETSKTVELIGGIAGYLASEGKSENVTLASSIAQSGAINNYLSHTQRARVEEIIDEMNACRNAGQFDPNGCSPETWNNLLTEARMLEDVSTQQTLEMLKTCMSGPSEACASHLEAAEGFEQWANGSAYNTLGTYVFVQPYMFMASTAGTEYEGQVENRIILEYFALDLARDIQSGAIDSDDAADILMSELQKMDGRLKIVGGIFQTATAGACYVTKITCALGLLNAAVGLDRAYEGTITVITGEDQLSAIEAALMAAGGYSKAEVEALRDDIENGVAIVTVGAGGALLIYKGGQAIVSLANVGDDIARVGRNAFDLPPNYRLLDDGISSGRPALPDGHRWVADADGNPAIQIPGGHIIDDTDEMSAIASGQVVYVNRGTTGEWSSALNRPKPNTIYKLDNGDVYVTDANGRVQQVSADLIHDPNARNGYQQRVSGRTCRQGTDCGGHLIASVFGGAGEGINLVPMNVTVNGTGGRWYQMEQSWLTALKNEKTVSVDIQPIYGNGGARPTEFVVTTTIDNIPSAPIKIYNTPTGLPE